MAVLEESASAEYLPDEAAVRCAGQLQDIIVAGMRDGEAVSLSFASEEGEAKTVTLAPALAKAFLELLQLVSSGKGSQVIPADTHFTTRQAAYLLNVQLSTLEKLLDEGKLPYFKIGRCRGIQAQKLFAYKKEKKARQKRALEEIARFDQEHGLL